MGRSTTALVLSLAVLAAGCSAATQHQNARSTPDNSTGERILLTSFNKWFSENIPSLQLKSSVETIPIGESKSFRIISAVLGPGGQAGEIKVDTTRPTVTKSKPDCSASWLQQCLVSDVKPYTVMSTADTRESSESQHFSIEVYDADNNLLALTTDGATDKSGPPPLNREQAINLSIACAEGFN